MNHNFPCRRENITVKPHLLHGKSILGGIYVRIMVGLALSPM